MGDAVFEWLLDGAPGAVDAADIAQQIGIRLEAGGVPLDRFHVFVKTLHPTVVGRQFRWTRGEPIRTFELTLAMQQSAMFLASPLAELATTRTVIRRRLDAPLAESDYQVLHELRADGFTDYLCAPLVFTSGELHALTFATRAPGGFTDAHLAQLHGIARPLALVAEVWALRRVAANLLDTYVGRHSGERILRGRIIRGDLETLQAVIWCSDLRDFTALSAQLAPQATVAVLNELFDCQVPAIERHGGEVLKFIGDGLLAIFPLGEHDIAARCRDALAASTEAFAALDQRNATATPIQFGLALHVGEVAYGNIGGASRLDFTAIGSAVNVASRLEGLTRAVGRRLVISERLAAHAGIPLDDLGSFPLKGVVEPQRVFAPH